MTLDDFIQKYDFNGSAVLLEGKRDVADADKVKLVALGKIVSSMAKDLVEGIEATIIYELSGYSFGELINIVRRSDFAIKNKAYQTFLLDSAKLVSKALDDDVELFIVPQNISYLLRDILDRMKHVRPGLKIIYESFQDFDLDDIQINYEK